MKIKNISYFSLLKFLFKNLMFDKTFIYFNVATLFFSLIFSFYSAFIDKDGEVAIIFDFYAIFFVGVVMFMLIIRICFYLFVRKTEDKTIFLIVSNIVSRLSLFISIYLISIIVIIFQVFLSFVLFNISFSIFHNVENSTIILQKTATFLWFAPLILICLLNFVIFLLMFVNNQVTMTFLTLLLAFTFVANLPLKFIKTSEESTRIKLNNNQIYNVSNMYEALDLQDYIGKGNIRFKNLSKFINNFLINEQNNITKSNISTLEKKTLRINLWKDLGILVDIKGDDWSEIKDLRFKNLSYSNSVPTSWVDSFKQNEQKKYDIKYRIDKRFIKQDELLNLIDNEKDSTKKAVLSDFYNFYQYLAFNFTDLQANYYSLFDDFIFLNADSKINAKQNECSASGKDCESSFLEEYLRSNYISFFYEGSDGKQVLFFDNENKDLEKLVKTTLNSPLMIATRLLENYFVSYTTTYRTIISNPIDFNFTDFIKYYNSRLAFSIFSIFSPYYSLWSSYTYYSGYAYDDIWFSLYSDSKIELYDQQNLFLPYVQYSFTTDENGKVLPNTYENFINPLIYLFLYLTLTSIAIGFSYWRFRKISL